MKITFMLTLGYEMGGTERAIYTQAEYLARDHDVEILSVFQTSEVPFFNIDPRVKVRHLIDLTGPTPRPVAPSRLTDAQCRTLSGLPSQLIKPQWEPAFTALSDVELERCLRELDTDILVSSTPALMSVATRLAPPHVITVNQEHRPTQVRGALGEPIFRFTPHLDAMIVLTERTRTWFEDTFLEYAPHLQVIVNAMPVGFRPRSTRTNRLITIAGRLAHGKNVEQAVMAFAQVADTFPDWNLRVVGDGQRMMSVRRIADGLNLSDRV